MNKHTPGPWEMDDKGSYGQPFGAYRVRVIDKNRRCVLTWDAKGIERSVFAAEANARLIAAAPEMLSALQALAETASNMLEAFRSYRPGAGYAVQQDLIAAVTAITKATNS